MPLTSVAELKEKGLDQMCGKQILDTSKLPHPLCLSPTQWKILSSPPRFFLKLYIFNQLQKEKDWSAIFLNKKLAYKTNKGKQYLLTCCVRALPPACQLYVWEGQTARSPRVIQCCKSCQPESCKYFRVLVNLLTEQAMFSLQIQFVFLTFYSFRVKALGNAGQKYILDTLL